MIKSDGREKLIEATLFFATHTLNCGKIKLIKLLYLLDFEHVRQTGRSVTSMEYRAWKTGPVPPELFHAHNSAPRSNVPPRPTIRRAPRRHEFGTR